MRETMTSPERWLEPQNLSGQRQALLEQLAAAFENSSRDVAERLDQFPKYVPITAVGRFLARYEMFRLIQDVPGCILEAGVLAGAGLFSFVHFSFLLEPHNSYRKLLGFDTFSGFPDLAEIDKRGTSAHMQVGGYADDSLSELRFFAQIHQSARFLQQREQIELVKGDITQTVPEYLISHPELVIALLYLDVDLYEPTKTCLTHLLPRIPKGGIVVFDQLSLSEYPGETAALVETVGIKNLRLRKLPFSKASFAVIE